MSVQIDKGNFDASTGTVTLAGRINGWNATATAMADGDVIYYKYAYIQISNWFSDFE